MVDSNALVRRSALCFTIYITRSFEARFNLFCELLKSIVTYTRCCWHAISHIKSPRCPVPLVVCYLQICLLRFRPSAQRVQYLGYLDLALQRPLNHSALSTNKSPFSAAGHGNMLFLRLIAVLRLGLLSTVFAILENRWATLFKFLNEGVSQQWLERSMIPTVIHLTDLYRSIMGHSMPCLQVSSTTSQPYAPTDRDMI